MLFRRPRGAPRPAEPPSARHQAPCRVGTSTFTSKSWTAMMAYLMVSLLNDTTCPTLVTTLSWVQALRHHYPFCHHVGRTFWTLELVWTLRPSLHHYRTSIHVGPQDRIKKLSAERGKLIHAHESSAKPRKVHISYTFGAIGASETKPKTIKNP